MATSGQSNVPTGHPMFFRNRPRWPLQCFTAPITRSIPPCYRAFSSQLMTRLAPRSLDVMFLHFLKLQNYQTSRLCCCETQCSGTFSCVRACITCKLLYICLYTLSQKNIVTFSSLQLRSTVLFVCLFGWVGG